MPGRFAAIVALCAVADGEAAFSERRACRIVDTSGFGHDGWRRLSMDGRHFSLSLAGCAQEPSLSALTILEDIGWRLEVGVEFTDALLGNVGLCAKLGSRSQSSSRGSELKARMRRQEMTYPLAHESRREYCNLLSTMF